MKLGDFIREYREEHSLSQRQFANDCGLSNGYISFLEKGVNPNTGKPITPTIPQLKKLADGFNLSLSELLEEIDDMPINISASVSPENLTTLEVSILNNFRSLNSEGQEKVSAYIEDLIRAGIYKNNSESFMVSKKA